LKNRIVNYSNIIVRKNRIVKTFPNAVNL